MELKLVVLAGAKEGLEIPLKKDKFLIGRAKECSLRAASEAISRRHCALIRTSSGRWAVRDLGSRNGTYLNDKRLTEPARLNAGDELRVGPLKFRITSIAPVEPAPTPAPAPTPTAASVKPRKQPPVKDVAEVVERTKSRSDDSATEDDISRWLFGTPDANGEETLKETRTIRLEETKAHNRVSMTGDTATIEDAAAVLDSASDGQPETAAGDVAAAEPEAKSGGWNLFKRGKGPAPKQKPGKLPPRPEQQSKDSREAAADILREMTRRR